MDFLHNALLATAYYAGLFDGEGSVNLYVSGNKQPNISVKLVNSFHPALMYPLNKFGGVIENNKASGKNDNWLDTFTWRVYSYRAYDFLTWIHPYTIIKKDQIDVISEFWSIKQGKHNKLDQSIIDQYISTLKSLKRGK